MGKYAVWSDNVIDDIILKVANENNIDPNIASRMIDDAFRHGKKAIRSKLIPKVTMGIYFNVYPALHKIKTKILLLSTEINPRILPTIELLEEIIERENKLRSNMPDLEKTEIIKKWKEKEKLYN